MFSLKNIGSGARKSLVPVLFAVALAQAVCAGGAQAQLVPALPSPNVPTLAPTPNQADKPGHTPIPAPSQSPAAPQDKPADGKQQETPAAAFLHRAAEHLPDFVRPIIGELVIVMPVLWMPLRVALLLVFVFFYVGQHFMRQRRAQLEAEQEGNSAVEAEFGLSADDDEQRREVTR